ncbi:pyrroline-5-carboxylate reductase [Sphingomonas sabuli]|uniref:Pyrroline-5-carboxylate reductase n=1 Tax=Sphingomonas sabuli TaxID=2764186 RepID=A0A7G9L490_9SPHN|nr:pyrroline-5-carboxylate reductase [Sphingomonas sabuli]QNM83439.1 pyrroline-5-carboxylate reductase [Sphingomonas sabuli]
MQIPVPTWFVGCGNMAGAMIDGWRMAGVDLSNAVAIRPSGTPVEGVTTVKSVKDAGAAPAMIILGFKPQQLDDVVPDLLPWITSKTIIVSLLAGVEAESLRRRFKKGIIVRAVPNLPVSVRRGVVALYADAIDEATRKAVGDLFAALGYAMWTDGEAALAGIGSVAGAGPAYVARFIAALAKAGEDQGLPAATAATIAQETVLGTAWMAAAAGMPMDELARRVASPNGTTEAGLSVLDRLDALNGLVTRTIDAARRRGAELAAEARGEQVA